MRDDQGYDQPGDGGPIGGGVAGDPIGPAPAEPPPGSVPPPDPGVPFTPTRPPNVDPGLPFRPTRPPDPAGGGRTGRPPGTGRGGGGGGTDDLPPPSDGGGDGSNPVPRPAPRPKIERVDVFERRKEPLGAAYGEVHVKGAHIVFDRILSNGRRVLCYLLRWGPIDSIFNVTIDGRTLGQLGLSGSDWNAYTGTTTDAIDPLISAIEPRWVSRYPGLAKFVVKLKRPSEAIPPIDVKKFECDIKAMLVRDPDSDPTLATRYYRDDPALAIADIECDPRFGGGFPLTAINWTKIAEARADCVEDLGGGRRRYAPIGIDLTETMEYGQLIEEVRGHGALSVAFNGGKRQWWVDKSRDATGLVFTDVGPEANIVSASPLVVKGSAELPSSVEVEYTNKGAEWKEDSVVSEDPGLVDGSVEFVRRSLRLRGVLGHDHAQRLAKQFRKRANVDAGGRIRVLAEGMRPLPGARVTITLAKWNWEGQDAQVLDVSPVPGRSSWDLDVEVWSDSSYDDAEETTTSYAPPANPSPYDAPDAPTSPAAAGTLTSGDGLEEELYQAQDGQWRSRLKVSWTDLDWSFPVRYRVSAQRTGGDEFEFADVLTGPVYLDPVDDLAEYTVRIYAYVVQTSAQSAALSGTITTEGVTGTPPDAENPDGDWQVSGSDEKTLDYLRISWDPPAGYAGREFRLYAADGVTLLLPPIPWAACPTAANPLDVTTLADFSSGYAGGFGLTFTSVVKVVSAGGVESAGLGVNVLASVAAASYGVTDPHMPQGVATEVELSATGTDNVALILGNGPGPIVFTVASGTGATIHGIAAMVGSVWPFVNRTGGALVWKNQSATEATSANRIAGPNGADVSVPDGFEGWAAYDSHGGVPRWRLFTADWSMITNRPTTLAGYGITDAAPLASQWTEISKSGDQSVVNSTTLVDDTELQFPVSNGKFYDVEMKLFIVVSNSNADYKFAVTLPTGCNWMSHLIGLDTAGNVLNLAEKGMNSAGWSGALSDGGNTNPTPVLVRFLFYSGGNGTFKWRFANNAASSGYTSTTKAKSLLRYRQLN